MDDKNKHIVRPGRTVQEQKIIQIPVSGLKLGMYVTKLDRPWEETPFLFQGFRIESLDDIDTISDICEYVYIEEQQDTWCPPEERSAGKRSTSYRTPSPPHVSGAQEYAQAQNLSSKGRQLTKSFLDQVQLGEAIDTELVSETVTDCMQSILRNPDAMLWLSKIRDRDSYTSEHCFNVCILALTFGRHLGFRDQNLIDLGICGMLHDVGKMRTPPEILNKAGPLDEKEFKIMKAHSVHGRDILMANKDVFHGAIDVAYSHHEALDGSGYPRGLKDANISEFSRIITLCDVYDAITSDRVYKSGQSSLRALKILYEGRGKRYDSNLVIHFIKCLGLFPPGSIVELKSGEIGIVLNTNYRNRRLPKVLIVRDGEKQDCKEHIVNLATEVSKPGGEERLIKTTLANGTHGVRLDDFVKKGLQVE